MTIVEALMEQDGRQAMVWRKTYRWRWLARLCNPGPHRIEGGGCVVRIQFRTI